MTATTRSPERASPLVWIALIGICAVLVFLAFSARNNPTIGGYADPNGVGPEGLKAARLFIEEAGGDTRRDLGMPRDDIDVAILAVGEGIEPIVADTGELVQSWQPLIDWIGRGGTLLTSVDIPGGPTGGVRFVEDEDGLLVVDRGTCSMPELDGISTIAPRGYNPLEIGSQDGSCFGDDEEAFLVVHPVGNGQIVRVSSMAVFFNQSFGKADNAALFARIIEIDDEPTVGFLPVPPIWFVIEEDAEFEIDRPQEASGEEAGGEEAGGEGAGEDGQEGGGGETVTGTPLDEADANPFSAGGGGEGEGGVGQGDQTLLDLIPAAVLALIASLVIAAILFALSKGRRLGSPVVEPVPIKLPSSSYVDAVGRLYRRTEHPNIRSAAILRQDLRVDLARRVGMSADASAQDIATALVSSEQQAAIVDLLDGPAPQSEEAFVALAAKLIETRERVERGGVASLATSEDIALISERTSR